MEVTSLSKGPSSAFESPTFEEDASFRLDKPVGSASISPCGRDIVLASRQGLHIIDLDSPWSPPRHLPHHTPWEVADVQWSPFAARDYWVVSTSNQKALVWNLGMIDSQASIEHYLHGHSRAITDINFSAHHPDILATCAVDSYVHCWDLRHPSRAAMTFCDWFAGATQVKWNRQDSHILASSHDKTLRIWDDRKGAYPLRSIEAHATKIYGVDWNRTEPTKVVTCSLDKTIKFWDYSSDSNQPMRTINAPFPVWRARHTPFGAGLLAMPQRGDYSLHLYHRQESAESQQSDAMAMVHRFDGHEGQVKEFLWRARGSVQDSRDSRNFQLVSWGTDRMLRLHRVDDTLLAKVGHVRGQQVERTIPFTRRDAIYRSFRSDPAISTGDIRDSRTGGPFRLGLHQNTGMSGISIRKHFPIIGGEWGTGEYPLAPKAGKQARPRADIDAISWMKGVKIGKRGPTQAGMEQSTSSVLSPVLRPNLQWDTFDSFAEEITHLADTFSKVTFEDVRINMEERQMVISLHGPFGPDKASVYIRCRIQVPPDYPNKEPPWPVLENTAGTNDETIMQATSDVQRIAHAYEEQGRHSLEAIMRYLLGEQSCDEILTLLRVMPDHVDMEFDQQLNFSSSSEDEGDDPYAKNLLPGLESSDSMLAVSHAQYKVPLPKACGALWADDGRLVCFFPSKEERPTPFLDASTAKTGEWTFASGRGGFEGFGRLQTGSQRTPSNMDMSEDGDSDYESSRAASDSSVSSDIGTMPLTMMPSMAWREAPQGLNRAFSVDESQRSSGGNKRSKSVVETSKSFITIHDCAQILPAKRVLAEEYVLGCDSRCCMHNAAVARKNGELDLAVVWDFVNLLLKDEVPLEQMQIKPIQEPVLLIAHRTVTPLRSTDSAIDLTYDSGDEDDPTLAVKGHKGQDSRQHSALPWLHPQATVERYYPSAEVAASILRPWMTQPAFTLGMQKAGSDPQSAASSIGASTSNPLTPFSASPTPPTSFKMNKRKHERSISQAPISTSPEQLKHLHRSGSNLASAFAASITRPFSFNTPESASPPATHPKSRSSPVASHLGTMTPNTSWGPLVQSKQITPPAQNERHDAISGSAHMFDTTLKNQDQFHNDGYAAEPLLDPLKEEIYAAYRSTYASMLLAWELPIASCTVLQYNTFVPRQSIPRNKGDYKERESLITIGRGTSIASTQAPSDFRLDIRNQCHR
ncbi:MAG: hypothetical protein LQ341_004341, partial [Variospora aurantia]